jgi:hypothetical protein
MCELEGLKVSYEEKNKKVRAARNAPLFLDGSYFVLLSI